MESTTDIAARVRAAIRDVPDFPKPGIVFKDITPVLGDPALVAGAAAAMAAPWIRDEITHVVAPESRGFLFGVPVAIALGAAFVPVRKPGKLPWRTRAMSYALEYGEDAIEMHDDAVPPGARVLVIDDVLATGGTADAACRLAEAAGATVLGCGFLLTLDFLAGRERLVGRRIERVVGFA